MSSFCVLVIFCGGIAKMRVLMFGWEFPPFSSGGLGTACYGLTKSLSKLGVEVIFVIPKAPYDIKSEFVKLKNARVDKDFVLYEHISVKSNIVPYVSLDEYSESGGKFFKGVNGDSVYGRNLIAEVFEYAKRAREIALNEDFDIIHVHDWLTYPAGIEAKKVSHKKLVAHIHATEFDRTAGHPNPLIYDIEKKGLEAADVVIAVSNFTKSMVVEHYGISPDKVRVVHNGVEVNHYLSDSVSFKIFPKDKIVLYLGRITVQKGPEYFLSAAKKVLEVEKNVKFIVAGSGDMMNYIVNKSAEMGLSDKVLFTGFLRGNDIERAYKMADVYVMPSVSEPFGITPLEAMSYGVPTIISKQSGVSEVTNNCLKVDFWDVNEIANKIVALLRYEKLHDTLKKHGSLEVKRINWMNSAKKCVDIYDSLLK